MKTNTALRIAHTVLQDEVNEEHDRKAYKYSARLAKAAAKILALHAKRKARAKGAAA